MGPVATVAAIYANIGPGIQYGSDLVQFFAIRPRHWTSLVDREMRFVRCFGPTYIHRHNQHRHASAGQSRLSCHCRLTARLARRTDFLAEDTAALIDGFEIDFLREIEPDFVTGDLARYQDDGGAIAMRFKQSV